MKNLSLIIAFVVFMFSVDSYAGNTVHTWNMASQDFSQYGESYSGPFSPAGWSATGWNNTGGYDSTVSGLSMAFGDTNDDIVLLNEAEAYSAPFYDQTFGFIAITTGSFYLDGTEDYRVGLNMSWQSTVGESDYLYAVLTEASSTIDYYSMYLGMESSNSGLIWTNHGQTGGSYSGADVLYTQGQFSATGSYKLTLMFSYDGYIIDPSIPADQQVDGLSSLDIDTVFIEESPYVVPAPGAVLLAGFGTAISGLVRRKYSR